MTKYAEWTRGIYEDKIYTFNSKLENKLVRTTDDGGGGGGDDDGGVGGDGGGNKNKQTKIFRYIDFL